MLKNKCLKERIGHVLSKTFECLVHDSSDYQIPSRKAGEIAFDFFNHLLYRQAAKQL